jgi:hypothetical protein
VGNHGSQQKLSTVPETESAPSPAEVSLAASALARLPRRPKRRWSGWIGPARSYRGMPIKLASGKQVFAFGCLRGRTVWSTLPDVLNFSVAGVGVDWGVVPASAVQVVRNPHAVFLGRLKAGTTERRSELKIASARANGLQPPRAGRRRGRPRGHQTSSWSSSPGL